MAEELYSLVPQMLRFHYEAGMHGEALIR